MEDDSDHSEESSNVSRRRFIESNEQSDESASESGEENGDDLCDDDEPENRNSREKDWATAPECIRHPRSFVSVDIFGAEFMKIPDDRVFTMDAVSKCWKTVPTSSESLLSNETEGGSWCFCEPCVAQIPRNIQNFIYFFHVLESSIDDLKFYAVPSKNVTLRRKRGEKARISDMIWHKPFEEGPRGGVGGDELDLNDVMCERGRKNARARNITERIAPFKLRLGFTGAVYRHNGEEHRKLIAVLVVTWARNWDMLAYIHDSFLHEPARKTVNYKQKLQEYKKMSFIWKSMLRFVAFDNLGLDENRCGMPEDYYDQPGGKLGCDSLFNMFNIPFQILGIIKQELLEKARREDPRATLHNIVLDRLDIIGLPRLAFKREETTSDFINYMHAYVGNLTNERSGLLQAIRTYYKPKEKGEGAADDEAMVSTFDLPFPGAWPLDRADGYYTRFGMPRFPIWLQFQPEFTPEMGCTFENWLGDVGGANGIPELVKTCLRSFLVQDLAASQESIWRTWDHFLRDKRPANPSLVLREYYGDKADPLSSLITTGYLRAWWLGVRKDIQAQRDRGLSAVDAAQSLRRYLLSSTFHHTSSIHSGAFRSPRIVQALAIVEKSEFRKTCVSDDPSSIRSSVRRLTDTLSNARGFDPYVRCNEAFWRCFEDLNCDFLMNSSNLEFMIEMMISQLLWMLGPNNETVVAYFQGLQQIAGNGHFNLSTKDGTFPDSRKPNSTGADWTAGRLAELFQILLDMLGFLDRKQNLQAPLNCMGWTPASIPLLTNATITDGQIESLPDPTLGLRSLIATEIRGDSKSMLIRGVFPRNSDGQEQFMINTCDPENTNKRKAQIKRRFTDLHFCGMASNVPDAKAEDAEMTKTLSTVLHVMPPGSGPHTKRQRTGAFNNVSCSAFGGRQNKPKNQESIANLLPFTHVWATSIPALMNKTNVIPAEISPTSLAFLDWLFFYTRETTDGILEKNVSESFKRMKDGYEARGVAKALWTKSILFLSQSKSYEDATQATLMSMFSNALPGHEVPAVVHSFLTRGLHMGSLLMISCIAKHLEVPIIPIEGLCEFFDQDAVPTSGEARCHYELIRNWLNRCIRTNRFCPENPGVINPFNNISIYVTSDGDDIGQPTSEKDTLLRIKRNKGQVGLAPFYPSSSMPEQLVEPQDEVHHAVGKRVKDIWGRVLFETCHMGPEQSVYANAIHDLLMHWLPDCRQLFSPHIFQSQRHLRKLGIHDSLPGIDDWPIDADRAPQFARVFHIHSPSSPVAPFALAVPRARPRKVHVILRCRP